VKSVKKVIVATLAEKINESVRVDSNGDFLTSDMARLVAHVVMMQRKAGWKLRPGWELEAFGGVSDGIVYLITRGPDGIQRSGDWPGAWVLI
jgi:hypothetical protein